MKVLIIGGTGLISTAITRALIARGEEVALYNRGISRVEISGEYDHIRGDRSDHARFEQQMAEAGPFDCVVDMVCFQPEDAESAVRAFRGRTAQYVFCSTVDVYTKTGQRHPINEDAEREPSPSFPYAYDKAACERVFEEAEAGGAFAVTRIRPAHTYGEGGRVIHTMGFGTYFLDRVAQGRRIVVHGDGRSLWSVCHRDDVGAAFANAVGNERTYGHAYHVTGEEWLTWNAYHRQLAQAMGAPEPDLVHIPTNLLGRALPERAHWCVENFSYNNIFDNEAARRDLDFEYTISWRDGIAGTVSWLAENDAIEDSDGYPFYDELIDRWQKLERRLVDGLADLR